MWAMRVRPQAIRCSIASRPAATLSQMIERSSGSSEGAYAYTTGTGSSRPSDGRGSVRLPTTINPSTRRFSSACTWCCSRIVSPRASHRKTATLPAPKASSAPMRIGMLNRRVDGLIVVGSRTDPRPSLGRELPVPVVYAYAPSEDPEDLSIICDNVAAGRLAIEHLIACGRTRIAHISGDPGYGAAQERAQGARSALKDAGLTLVGDVRFGAWSEGWGRAATSMLLS